MYYVIFKYKDIKTKYYLEFDTKKESYRFVICLMYCDDLKNRISDSPILFSHIKVKQSIDSSFTYAQKSYKLRVYEWIKRGYI